MKQEKWFAVEITVRANASEAIEFALNELDSLGNEINNLGKKDQEDICVIGYFNELPDGVVINEHIENALKVYDLPKTSVKNISTKQIENQDWLAEWKKHWKPTETEKFIISPPWETIENTDKLIIRIEPNMAFGTGTHETTKLCLRAIENIYQPEMSFFDVGTGTGILSIAVSKILKDKSSKIKNNKQSPNRSEVDILACDTDEDSIKIARENAELNDAEEIEFYVGSISEDSPKFDLVCANVTADIILPLLPLLIDKTEKILLLSGILVEQEALILNELKKHKIENSTTQIDGEWVSITINFNE